MQFKILCYAEPIDAVKSLKKGAYLSQKLTTLDANLITNQHFLLIIIFYARSRLLGFQFILIFRNFGDNQVLEDGMMCTCSRNGNQCKIQKHFLDFFFFINSSCMLFRLSYDNIKFEIFIFFSLFFNNFFFNLNFANKFTPQLIKLLII